MNKKQLIITAVSLLVSISVFACNDIANTAAGINAIITGENNAAYGDDEFSGSSSDNFTLADDEMKVLFANLRSNGYYYDEIKELLIKYNELVVSYSLSENERTHIIEESASGNDFILYLDICSFLKMTDTDLTAADEIYRLSDTNSDDAVESAYAEYMGQSAEELTVADVRHYVEQGIAPEEIAAVYELTLKGCKNVREVLDDYISGESWSDIISRAYFLDDNTFGKNATLADIASIKNIADKTGCGMNAIIEINESERPFVTSNAAEIYTEKQTLVNNFNAEIGTFENLDSMIAEETAVKLPYISSDDINHLMKQGYRIRDIENAVSDNTLAETETGAVITESGAVFK